MYANLMGAAGLWPCLEERHRIRANLKTMEHGKFGEGFARLARVDRDALALRGMASQRPGNGEAVVGDDASHERKIDLAHAAIFKLLRKRHPRKRSSCNYHYARRFLVEPMHNAGPHQTVRFGYRGEVGKPSRQCIGQRRIRMTRRWMHCNAGWLVHRQ